MRISTPTTPDRIVVTSAGLALAVTSSDTTYFIVRHPHAGRWKVTLSRGTPSPVKYELADPLQPLGIAAQITGTSRRRILHWRLRPRRGETARFIQQGAGEQTITITSAARGKVPFKVAPGPGGRRTILALISIDGFPREMITVAHFRVAAPSPPRVRRATYHATSNSIIVRWTRARGARYYTLYVRLTNGSLRYRLPATTTSATVRYSGGKIRQVSIQVTNSRGITGPSVAAKRR